MSERKTPTYSDSPAAGINISRLSSTRFIEATERKYPFRDSIGRVNIHLVNSSLACAEVDGAPPATCERLRAWQRHAVRAINNRPKDEQVTLDDLIEPDEDAADEVPKTVPTMRKSRIVYSAACGRRAMFFHRGSLRTFQLKLVIAPCGWA